MINGIGPIPGSKPPTQTRSISEGDLVLKIKLFSDQLGR